jgi:hypothetical protein
MLENKNSPRSLGQQSHCHGDMVLFEYLAHTKRKRNSRKFPSEGGLRRPFAFARIVKYGLGNQSPEVTSFVDTLAAEAFNANRPSDNNEELNGGTQNR